MGRTVLSGHRVIEPPRLIVTQREPYCRCHAVDYEYTLADRLILGAMNALRNIPTPVAVAFAVVCLLVVGYFDGGY